MGILSNIDDILAEGDVFTELLQKAKVCSSLFNEFKSKRDHNMACKFLVSELCNKKLNLNDVNFNLRQYPGISYSFISFVDLRHIILVYTPAKGGRSAIIHILNLDKDIDNIKFDIGIFKLGEYHVDVYDNTVFYDISDNKLIFKEFYKNLKIQK